MSAMKPQRESSTTGPDRKMIDRWSLDNLQDAGDGRAERLADETRMVRKALDLETPSLPVPWRDDAAPALLR